MTLKHLRKTAFLAIILCLICLLALAGATYAWFTTNSVVSTSKIEATTASTDVQLLLSAKQNPFDGKQEFTMTGFGDYTIMPVSTSDLEIFCYNSGAEIGDDEHVVYHEEIYLMAQASAGVESKLAIYLDNTSKDLLTEGTDSLLLNGARFGFKFTNTADSKDTKNANPIILRTSETANDTDKQRKNTVLDGTTLDEGYVLQRDSAGNTTAVADPSVALDTYCLKNEKAKALAVLDMNTIYKLDFYFYLEGTDPDCSEALAKNDCSFHLNFYGTLTEE